MAAVTLAQHASLTRDMVPHYRTLRRLATRRRSVVEFGVRTGVSTWALLDAVHPQGTVTSVDIETPNVPVRVADDLRWSMRNGDDRNPQLQMLLPKASLVFIDTSHEYHHTLEELALAERLGATLIVLHDYALPDVRDAIDGFCARHPWRIAGIEPSQWSMAWIARR